MCVGEIIIDMYSYKHSSERIGDAQIYYIKMRRISLCLEFFLNDGNNRGKPETSARTTTENAYRILLLVVVGKLNRLFALFLSPNKKIKIKR